MTTQAGAPPIAARTTIKLRSRIVGFGSIYGKTMRDSRLSLIIAAGLMGGMALLLAAAVPSVFPNAAARHEIDKLIGAIPASMVNLFGKPVGLGTLGGYFTWKYGPIFALGAALWSIMALSGTLAGEAGRGSLDLVASTPFGKRRVALEKLAAHVTVLTLALAVLALACWAGSRLFGDAALGDTIEPLSAVGFSLWLGFLALFFGGLAFALGPILGRAGSAGVAAAVLIVLWLANGFEALNLIATVSPFRWTADHIALVGQYDWAGLALVGIVAAAFLAIGVELFARRDLGVTSGLSMPGLPKFLLGVQGSGTRAFGEQLPRALSWGLGLGLMGALIGALVGTLSSQIGSDPGLSKTFGTIFPTVDLASAGGWFQLYAEFLFIAAGFGAATFVSKWASDETGGRLEMLLSTPLARSRWVVSGGISAILAVVVMTALFAAGIWLGATSGGAAAGNALTGSAALGIYALAVVGIGVAVGGLWRTSIAAEVAAVFVVLTYIIDLVVPALKLPDWIHQFALTAHLGQPMLGIWDPAGIAACVAIAVGGIAIGAIGIRRRDVE